MEKKKPTMEEMEINKFYKNKRILITGHNGFKGTWLTLWLLRMGSIIKGISIKGINDDHYNSLKLKVDQSFIDINNYNKLKKEIVEFKPEIIFHLAAQSIVGTSYKDTIGTINTNVIGVANILDICKEIRTIKTILIVTSDKVYEPSSKNINIESDRIGGDDPYSASKAASEIVFNSFLKSFYLNNSIKIASVRAGNVLGGGDWSEGRLIPDSIKSIINKKKLIVRDPSSVRPWQFVLDCLFGYLLLNMKLYHEKKYEGNWNFGPSIKNKKIQVNKILSIIENKFNNFKFTYSKKTVFKESKILMVSSKKANLQLNWKPIYNFKDTLNETLSWYEGHINNEKRTHQILDNYINLLNKKIK